MTLSTAFAVLYWAWIATEVLLQLVTPTGPRGGKLRDRGSLLVLLPVIFASVWAAIWYGETHMKTMNGSPSALKLASVLLIAAGLTIRWAAIFTLGSSFSTNVAIHATQRLRTTGLYRWVRHPSYSGMLLIFAAIGVRERSWGSLAIMLVFPTAALIYRIHVEELALTEAFSDTYPEYRKSTKRLVPGIY